MFQGSIRCSKQKIKCEPRYFEDFLLQTSLTTLSDVISIRVSHSRPIQIYVSIFEVIGGGRIIWLYPTLINIDFHASDF